MFKYILNRLTERIAAGMAVAGLIGIVTKDRKKEQENHDNG